MSDMKYEKKILSDSCYGLKDAYVSSSNNGLDQKQVTEVSYLYLNDALDKKKIENAFLLKESRRFSDFYSDKMVYKVADEDTLFTEPFSIQNFNPNLQGRKIKINYQNRQKKLLQLLIEQHFKEKPEENFPSKIKSAFVLQPYRGHWITLVIELNCNDPSLLLKKNHGRCPSLDQLYQMKFLHVTDSMNATTKRHELIEDFCEGEEFAINILPSEQKKGQECGDFSGMKATLLSFLNNLPIIYLSELRFRKLHIEFKTVLWEEGQQPILTYNLKPAQKMSFQEETFHESVRNNYKDLTQYPLNKKIPKDDLDKLDIPFFDVLEQKDPQAPKAINWNKLDKNEQEAWLEVYFKEFSITPFEIPELSIYFEKPRTLSNSIQSKQIQSVDQQKSSITIEITNENLVQNSENPEESDISQLYRDIYNDAEAIFREKIDKKDTKNPIFKLAHEIKFKIEMAEKFSASEDNKRDILNEIKAMEGIENSDFNVYINKINNAIQNNQTTQLIHQQKPSITIDTINKNFTQTSRNIIYASFDPFHLIKEHTQKLKDSNEGELAEEHYIVLTSFAETLEDEIIREQITLEQLDARLNDEVIRSALKIKPPKLKISFPFSKKEPEQKNITDYSLEIYDQTKSALGYCRKFLIYKEIIELVNNHLKDTGSSDISLALEIQKNESENLLTIDEKLIVISNLLKTASEKSVFDSYQSKINDMYLLNEKVESSCTPPSISKSNSHSNNSKNAVIEINSYSNMSNRLQTSGIYQSNVNNHSNTNLAPKNLSTDSAQEPSSMGFIPIIKNDKTKETMLIEADFEKDCWGDIKCRISEKEKIPFENLNILIDGCLPVYDNEKIQEKKMYLTMFDVCLTIQAPKNKNESMRNNPKFGI